MSKPNAKHLARSCALQGLYQWQLSGNDLNDIDQSFAELVAGEQEMAKVNRTLFDELLHQIPARVIELDEAYEPFLDREADQLDPIELVILRIGAYELLFKPELPYRVAINEGVELAKEFGAEQSHRYINGILDKLAQKVRAIEVAANKKQRASKG
ncbi:MAG: transcription antitermination factor NusB [Gammaproteobacteria bacterium]|nr:transcription antitermination factor NusB [Gammaproteobacteria bacterium]MCW8983106.1 transcription antitermination factor NusB [Gammaproteobacteria bacterium]